MVVVTLGALGASGATRYVNVNNLTPEFPYDQFTKAATVIQDAVDAAAEGDLILVTNGVYSTGGRAHLGTNQVGMTRVVVDKPLNLRSSSGPGVTIIRGERASKVRCVYLVNGAILSGFTLTNGAAGGSGGGILCESSSAVVTNCILTKNEASSCGGGVYSGTLFNCTLTENAVVGGFGLEGWSGAGGVRGSPGCGVAPMAR